MVRGFLDCSEKSGETLAADGSDFYKVSEGIRKCYALTSAQEKKREDENVYESWYVSI